MFDVRFFLLSMLMLPSFFILEQHWWCEMRPSSRPSAVGAYLDGVPYSERPPYITGVRSSGGASLVMENVVCKGLGDMCRCHSLDGRSRDNYRQFVRGQFSSTDVARGILTGHKMCFLLECSRGLS